MSEAYLGEIRLFAGNYAPENWALCNGALLSISSYEALYTILGLTYGGDGKTTFGLPDYRGRLPVGQGTGLGLTPRVLAQTMGTETCTVTEANTPPHTHLFMVSTNTANSATPVDTAEPGGMTFGQFTPSGTTIKGLYSAGTGTAQAVTLNPQFLGHALGSGGSAAKPHDNMMGSLAINYIICLLGVYPTRP